MQEKPMSVVVKSIPSTISIYKILPILLHFNMINMINMITLIITLSTEKSNYGTKNCLRSVYDMVVTNDRNTEQKNIYIGWVIQWFPVNNICEGGFGAIKRGLFHQLILPARYGGLLGGGGAGSHMKEDGDALLLA